MKKFLERTCVSLLIVFLFIKVMRVWERQQESQASSFAQTFWATTKDWTMTVDGVTFQIEFGFRGDGVVLWRKGVVNGGNP